MFSSRMEHTREYLCFVTVETLNLQRVLVLLFSFELYWTQEALIPKCRYFALTEIQQLNSSELA